MSSDYLGGLAGEVADLGAEGLSPVTWAGPPSAAEHDVISLDLGGGPAWYQVEHLGHTDAGPVYWVRPVSLGGRCAECGQDPCLPTCPAQDR